LRCETFAPGPKSSCHVDFEPDLAAFYFDACGFRPTDAGLIHLHAAKDV
jgi:hypothetical protein